MDFQLIDLSRFSSAVWDDLAPERRTPMQEHLWTQSAAEVLSPDRPCKVATIGSPDAPAALAPLTVSARGAPRYRLLGAEELGEPVEVIYRDEASLVALAKGLAGLDRPLSFGHYLSETPFTAYLRAAYLGRGAVVTRALPMRAAPYITLSDAWLEPEQNFTTRRRSDFRRMQRKATKLGEVRTDILSPSIDEVDALIDEAFTIETRSWKGETQTAIAFNAQQASFYRLYGRRACEAGMFRVCFLRISGQAAAMQLAVETNNRFWLLKIGYDDVFKACSPGNLLLRETIRYAARRKHLSYEFLGKEAQWTKVWTSQARTIVALRTYPYNLAGVRAASTDATDAVKNRISKSIDAKKAQAHA